MIAARSIVIKRLFLSFRDVEFGPMQRSKAHSRKGRTVTKPRKQSAIAPFSRGCTRVGVVARD